MVIRGPVAALVLVLLRAIDLSLVLGRTTLCVLTAAMSSERLATPINAPSTSTTARRRLGR